MEIKTREKMVVELIEHTLGQSDDETFGCILREGCQGYDNMPDREIMEYHLFYVDCDNQNDSYYVYHNEDTGYKATINRHIQGIGIDGKHPHWEYI